MSDPRLFTPREGIALLTRQLLAMSSIASPWWLAAALMAPAAASAAGTATELQQQALAATCAQCHGTQGRAVPGTEVPGLAGLPAASLVEKMAAFRAGTRPATVMQQIAKGYSAAQIDALAAYFAVQPR